ncbi:MAG: hypothetical protein NVV66_18270 [Cellulomonas sp.]|uniref:hypothetical protein n=1 Tax=Cellulomonas sp. TaxID=40001 RepID=UPI00258CEB03|nr:hypothetical protein [Cellulomonas sp.]MCR6706543.1 hypothetical protein [Cellulomonas sp.]
MPAPTGSSPTVPGTPAGGAGNGFKKYFEDLWAEIVAVIAAIFPVGTGGWTSYSPSIGSGWAAGTYTLTARYTQVGKTVRVRLRVVITGASALTTANSGFGLPVTPQDPGWITGTAEFFDASALSYIGGRVSGGQSTTQVYAVYGNGTTSTIRQSNTVPVAPAVGDVLTLDFTYEAA